MGVFKIFKEKTDSDNLNQIQQGQLFHSIEYEISGILKMVNEIDSINDNQICDVIVRQHAMILNYDLFLSGDTRAYAQALFTSKKFLKCFISVVRLLNISQHEKVCLNKLAYDYYIWPGEKDNEIVDMLYQLTTEVNGKEVVVLSGIIGLNRAKTLSMVRNSSFKEEKCVHRTNTFIVKFCNELNVEQLTNVYRYLFEDNFSSLFIFSMMEGDENLHDQSEYLGYNVISITILSMLCTLPSADIKKIIIDYLYILHSVKLNSSVRFTLKQRFNNDRLNTILKEISIVEEIELV